MNNDPQFVVIWRRFEEFEFEEVTAHFCRYAEAFQNWASTTLEINSADLVTLNQAKVLLVDKYFEFFSIVPKNHRYYFHPKGHICIYQVFLDTYRRIKARELSLTPPMLFIPPPPKPTPPPPPAPQIAGIFFGEEE